MKPFAFNIPTKIIFGENKIKQLNDEIDPKLKNVLIVTDNNILGKTDIVNQLKSILKDKNISVISEIEENPSIETIDKCVNFAKKERLELIIGLGGGSSMDAAKGIAILATNSGSIREYLEGKQFGNNALPVICIPTSSGTGSEATPYAVFTDKINETKAAIAHPSIFPVISIVDPVLTYSMPKSVVLNTGLDALTHSIEAYLSTESFDLNDQIALRSISTVLEHLEKAVAKVASAMAHMAYASLLGGIAISHASTILPHIMGYPLTVYHNVPHGLANALVMPAFLEFMAKNSTVKDKVDRLSTMFESKGGVRGFLENLGVSTGLASYGVSKDELENFCSKVIVKGDVKITPANITNSVIKEIYLNSF